LTNGDNDDDASTTQCKSTLPKTMLSKQTTDTDNDIFLFYSSPLPTTPADTPCHHLTNNDNNDDTSTTQYKSTMHETTPPKWINDIDSDMFFTLSLSPDPPTDKPCRHSTNDDNEDDPPITQCKSTMPETAPPEWTNDIDSNISFNSSLLPASPANKPHHHLPNTIQRKEAPPPSAP
jgi:hypothetical protein